jgi:hypothetical protein
MTARNHELPDSERVLRVPVPSGLPLADLSRERRLRCPKKVLIGFPVPAWAALEAVAAEEGLAFAALVRGICEAWLKERARKMKRARPAS